MDENYFIKIINDTKGVVLSAVERYLYDDYYHSIDDVVQETYIRAFKSFKKNSFRGESKLTTWLYAIAKNESLRMNRKLSKDKNLSSKIVENEICNEDSKSNLKIIKEKIELLKKKIFHLPEKYRSVINLYISGKKETAIADELSISRATVKMRLFRGKKMLINLFKSHREE
ncbi:MAG TPA: RNA polymerase sigma factor [bacterium]|nr:RNA polymerase sigma factor [bacterium]HPN29317.1 RNA polymerase sigma factor [bacterium]